MKYVINLIFIVFITAQSNPKSQISLDGFYISQYRSSFVNNFGIPIQRIDTDDGWIYEFYKVEPDTSIYFLTKATNEDTNSVISIQLNGSKYGKMIPFLGLKLGDSKQKVFDVLGKYETIKELDNPKVDIYYFKNKNYSIEIDKNDKLYGIQIFGFTGLENTNDFPNFDILKNSILNDDIVALQDLLMPNFEIYIDNKVLFFNDRPKSILSNKNSEIYKALFSGESSLKKIFQADSLNIDMQMRMTSEPKRLLQVIKFPTNKYLQEIVYWGHADKLKIWEIKFR